MAEYMGELRRTNYCGDLRAHHIGQEVVVCGWVSKQRDLGQLIFIDLRDRTGIVQLAFDDTTSRDVFDKAFGVRSEYVLCARGKVQERSAKNPEIPTGDVEILVEELRVLSKAQTPPFEIVDDCKTAEDVRLKYRYLDLRRKPLQDNIIMRSKIAKVARDYFYENGFIEIETPMLIKSTPEGARDYLVPSRIHKGSFYALPQSPQIYKQLLMLSGFDRYIQLARCFRDEDLRADRQPEFTQIDMELSFASVEEIMEINEGLFKRLFKEILGKDLETPFEKMTYADAMNRFGSDKPDVRFGMEIKDVSDIVADCGFGVFSGAVKNGGSVRAIVAENGAGILTRKEIDKLTEYVRGIGAKGLAFIRWVDEEPSCSFKKFLTDEEFNGIIERTGAKKGDVVLFVADKNSVVLSTLGALRLNVAKKLDIIPDEFKFVWIVDFPFFEFDEDLGQFVAMHHPFTAPMDECLPYLESDKANVRAKCYDLVLNGIELSSGSIRITDPVLQNRIFELLGMSDEEAYAKFGFLLDAFRFGAPPHGGMGIGLDRLVMQMLQCETLRDVVAFPKVQNASELMTMAPGSVDEQQLEDLGICLKGKEE